MYHIQHLIPPLGKSIEPFVWWDNGFTDNELDFLQEKARKASNSAEVGSNQSPIINSNIRRSQVSWMEKTPDVEWLYEKLSFIIAKLNLDYYNFNITGFGESLQLTNYSQYGNGMYNWHQDYGGVVSRKLSVVLQLSDPLEYEGGELQVMTSSSPVNIQKKRGLIAMFPSYVLHQVTPVTYGSRQSLVAWISGPAFK